MKKIIIFMAIIVLTGCQSSSTTKQFLSKYFKYVNQCQMDEVNRLTLNLDEYYNDCTRVLEYASESFQVVKEVKQDNEYFVYVENNKTKEQTIWHLLSENQAFVVLSFEKVVNK